MEPDAPARALTFVIPRQIGGVDVGVRVEDALRVAGGVADAVELTVGALEDEGVPVDVDDPEPVTEPVLLRVPLEDGVPVWLEVPVRLPVPLDDGVPVWLAVPVRLPVRLPVPLDDGVPVWLEVPVPVTLPVDVVDSVGSTEVVAVGVTDELAVCERVTSAALAARIWSRDVRASERGGELHSPLGSSHSTRLRTPPLSSRLRTMPLTLPTKKQLAVVTAAWVMRENEYE